VGSVAGTFAREEGTNVRVGTRERMDGRDGRRRRCLRGGGEEDVRAVDPERRRWWWWSLLQRRDEKGIAKSAIEESRVAGDEAARGPRWPGRFDGG
jgi:hypothetical protein